jgi:hypothetical protein
VSLVPSPPPGEAARPHGICPHCGAPTAPGQEYCLECGERLTGVAIISAATVAQRLPIARASWFWPAVVGFLVMGIGVVAAIVLTQNEKKAANVVIATAPTLSIASPPVTRTTEVTLPGASTPNPTSKPRTVIEWPASRSSGYTIVLASMPRSGGRAVALALARKALRDGLPQVGIIDSARFASLHPGYFVVFSGIYEGSSTAASALAEVHAKGFNAAYARQVSR